MHYHAWGLLTVIDKGQLEVNYPTLLRSLRNAVRSFLEEGGLQLEYVEYSLREVHMTQSYLVLDSSFGASLQHQTNWPATTSRSSGSKVMCVKIIGYVPDGAKYLIGSDEYTDGEVPPEDAAARVLDLERDMLFKPRAFHSITAHIPRLTEYDGDEEIDQLLTGVEIQGPPIEETPFKLDSESP